MLDSNKLDIEVKEKSIKKNEVEKEKFLESLSISSQEQENQEVFYKIEEIPLLTMNNVEYSKFLEHHQNKVVCLVDVPNFIRTLRALFPRNFEDVLKKAHRLLLEYIENSFHTSSDYIVRYFSKPDKDLEIPNNIIINFCSDNPNKEIFHLLKVLKGAGYSDIDNYLIANGVEILERFISASSNDHSSSAFCKRFRARKICCCYECIIITGKNMHYCPFSIFTNFFITFNLLKNVYNKKFFNTY